jgi:hypothetical protein
MQPVVGVFMHRAEAERLMEPLQALGVPKKHLSLLSPCFPEEIETVPMMDTERPLIGTVLGGLVGFALSGGGGLLGAELLGIVIPGVGPILTVGTVAVALLATAGAVGGAEVGSGIERAFTTGIPKDEVFIYEDALRKGRTVLIALAEDAVQAEAVHRMLEHAGAESIDAARHHWWLGLRRAEEATYTAQGDDVTTAPPVSRCVLEERNPIPCQKSITTTKTVVGLYDTSAQARQVMQDLLQHGVPRHEMSLIMPHPEGQEAERPNGEEETAAVVRHHGAEHLGMGAVLGGIGGLVVGLSTLVIPGFGPMIVAGPLAIALAGAGVGAYAGVIAGSLIHLGVSEQEAGHYAERLRRGGALVVVQLPHDLADRAEGIMNRHQPVNLEERVSH